MKIGPNWKQISLIFVGVVKLLEMCKILYLDLSSSRRKAAAQDVTAPLYCVIISCMSLSVHTTKVHIQTDNWCGGKGEGEIKIINMGMRKVVQLVW